jgi:hypothetical protein
VNTGKRLIEKVNPVGSIYYLISKRMEKDLISRDRTRSKEEEDIIRESYTEKTDYELAEQL